MNRQETAAILKVMKVAYPYFYSKIGADDYQEWIGLWSTVFANDDAQVVTAAVKDLIQTHTGFPPEIADVRRKITEIVNSVTGTPSDEEYWSILKAALDDGVYGAKEQFSKLPAPLKRFCGSESWIRDHARMDTEVIDSVVHGQFLKTFPKVREAQEYRDSLPEPVKQVITKLFKPLDEYKPLSESAVNDRKNLVFQFLEAGA